MNRKWIALFTAFSLVRISFATEPTESPEGGDEGDGKGVFTRKKEKNLLSNPGFENKTSKWVLGKVNGGAGLFTTDTISPISDQRSAKIFTKNIDREAEDLSLFTFMPLEKGMNYTFSFKADVGNACLITVSFDNGDKSYFSEALLLKSGLHAYGPFTFEASDDDIFNRLCFNLGKTNTVIRLDDILVNADYKEKGFDEVIANSDINLQYEHDEENNSIHVSLPQKPVQDIPFLVYDENNNVIYANKITKRRNEATITLNRKRHTGNYRLDVYLASHRETINLHLK